MVTVTISIVTPFHNCPELLADYEKAVRGAQVIAIDNGSDQQTADALRVMVKRLGNFSFYIRNEQNELYSHANNQGLHSTTGEIVVFLNSDIVATGDWLACVAKDTKPGALYGANAGQRTVNKIVYPYLEGWCLWGYKSDFERIGGWNEKDFHGLYWEDNELCYRAVKAGLKLMQAFVPLKHLSNYTSSRTAGSYDHSGNNSLVFERIVNEGRK